jgi:hypothetical protein
MHPSRTVANPADIKCSPNPESTVMIGSPSDLADERLAATLP